MNTTPTRTDEVKEMLAYIATNPPDLIGRSHWVAEVRQEAVQLGLIPAPKNIAGQSWKPGRPVMHGADFEDVF